MDIEQTAETAVEEGKSAVHEALALMDSMNALKGKLNIKYGAGVRFLQKIKPDESQLHQAEQEIVKSYSGPAPRSPATKKRRNMLGALARQGRA
ncbi:MAG: hypothetical protein ACR2PT_21265 [Endozoicomonas sp.]